jgi:hypothetical protein
MAKQALHFARNLRQGRIQSFQARIDDDGALRIQPIETRADRLAKAPLKTIPHHGRPQRPRNRETDSGTRAAFRPFQLPDAKGREQRAGESGTPLIYPSEIL